MYESERTELFDVEGILEFCQKQSQENFIKLEQFSRPQDLIKSEIFRSVFKLKSQLTQS